MITSINCVCGASREGVLDKATESGITLTRSCEAGVQRVAGEVFPLSEGAQKMVDEWKVNLSAKPKAVNGWILIHLMIFDFQAEDIRNFFKEVHIDSNSDWFFNNGKETSISQLCRNVRGKSIHELIHSEL